MSKESTPGAELHRLEQTLLDPAVRRDAVQLDLLLDDAFQEIGASGRRYDKAQVIAALQEDPGFDAPRSIAGFEARELSEDVVLVTYRVPESRSLRSSIWRRAGRAWRLVFHQGTRAS